MSKERNTYNGMCPISSQYVTIAWISIRVWNTSLKEKRQRTRKLVAEQTNEFIKMWNKKDLKSSLTDIQKIEKLDELTKDWE